MFFCEYSEILQNSFFFRTPLSASADSFSTIGQFSNNMKDVGGRRGRRLACHFLKIEKSVLTLEKRPDCVHLWVKIFIRNVVFNSIQEKKVQNFPCWLFFCIFDEMFIEVPQFHETSPALKIFWLHARYFSTKSVLLTACIFTKRKIFYLTILLSILNMNLQKSLFHRAI